MRQKIMLSGLRIYFQTLFALSSERGAEKVLALFSKPQIRKIRARDDAALASARREVVALEAGRSVMTYAWGDGARGVLCVHGWEGNAGNFGAFIQPLTENGFRVYAFDAPAHGYSLGKTTNMFQYAEAIHKLLELHPEIDTIIGHSFGSAASVFALTHYKQHPIKQLALLTIPDKPVDFLYIVFGMLRLSKGQQTAVLKKFESRFGFPISDLSSVKFISKLDARIQILHDKYEKILPFSESQRAAEAAQHGHLEVLEHVGHYKMLWSEDVVRRVVEFLK